MVLIKIIGSAATNPDDRTGLVGADGSSAGSTVQALAPTGLDGERRVELHGLLGKPNEAAATS